MKQAPSGSCYGSQQGAVGGSDQGGGGDSTDSGNVLEEEARGCANGLDLESENK